MTSFKKILTINGYKTKVDFQNFFRLIRHICEWAYVKFPDYNINNLKFY